MPLTLARLRRYAIARSLFRPTSLGRAIDKLGFVQADPIRAPARAQDLTLRLRVADYTAGDLERRYPRMPVEEDYFVNYGFLPRAHHDLMHPRVPKAKWTPARARKAAALLEFIRDRREAHPREVDAHFAHGKITNWFGGSSNATTQLLDEMHYRGILRVARRDAGIRVYAVREAAASAAPEQSSPGARMDALVDVIVRKYAPLPSHGLAQLMSYLRGGAPQWSHERAPALERAKRRLGSARVEGIDWYWPASEDPGSRRWRLDDGVRLLAPFDPIVWDRRRFETFWRWAYRFEAYTPAPKRKLGYYALPLLWRDEVIGWANLSVSRARLHASFGFVAGRAPGEPEFQAGLDRELAAIENFLKL